ncbi:unnamed protein product [Prorocentrum cordatum]|uniref:Subtilisin n=1 Tax=Prorocentrum cordatum TaxID=2364126 RepID=A0ABN9VQ80_9DINO|nr:unnamed protein product [Polarella glacialis]
METQCVSQDFPVLTCPSGTSQEQAPELSSGSYPEVLCRVCGTPVLTVDSAPQAFVYTGKLTFGQNQLRGSVTESMVIGYELYWTYGDGAKADLIAYVNVDAYAPTTTDGCCVEDHYTVELNSVDIRGTHVMIVLVVEGLANTSVSSYSLPQGVEVGLLSLDDDSECPPMAAYLYPADPIGECTATVKSTAIATSTATADTSAADASTSTSPTSTSVSTTTNNSASSVTGSSTTEPAATITLTIATILIHTITTTGGSGAATSIARAAAAAATTTTKTTTLTSTTATSTFGGTTTTLTSTTATSTTGGATTTLTSTTPTSTTGGTEAARSITLTSTTATSTAADSPATVMGCDVCAMTFFTGCTFAASDVPGKIMPGVPCTQTFDPMATDMSDKFYVEASPCVEYAGSLSMTCPAGNSVADRAAVWETVDGNPQWYSLHQALPQVVCQVCDMVLGMDTDMAENSVTFELTFGPNMIHGEINQIDVQGYEVYWVGADGVIIDSTPTGIALKPSDDSENVKASCGCDASKYSISFVSVPVPTGAEGLMVAPVDSNGYTMPVGRVASVSDTFARSTVTTVSQATAVVTAVTTSGTTATAIAGPTATTTTVPTVTVTTTVLALPPTVNSQAPGSAQLSVAAVAFLVAAGTSSAQA